MLIYSTKCSGCGAVSELTSDLPTNLGNMVLSDEAKQSLILQAERNPGLYFVDRCPVCTPGKVRFSASVAVRHD